MAWKSSFRQNYRTTFSPTVPTSATGISHVVADVEAPVGEKWEHLKSEGKQWQATPKNLPRMQCTRAIPVAWLNSGLCPDRSKGWIPVIIIMWEQNCGSTHSKPRHYMTERGYIYAPAALAPDKNPDTYWRLGGPQTGLDGYGEYKISFPCRDASR